jgi:hypothetical protein
MGLRQPSLGKGRRTILIALALAAAAVFAVLLARAGEPSYNGHRLSSWVKLLSPRNLQDFGPGCRKTGEAEEAIRSMGTNSLPYLVKWLSYQGGPTPVRDAVKWGIAKCPRLGKIKALRAWAWFDTKDVRGDGAALAFQFLRPTASPAIPSLLQVATKPGNTTPQFRALYALVDIGPPSLSALVSIITNRTVNPMVRDRAAESLGYFGPSAEFALPELLIALQDQDSCVASGAADALGMLGLQPARVVPALIGASRRPDTVLELSAVRALGKFGPEAREAIPALQEIDRSNDTPLRRYACAAIAAIQELDAFVVIAEIEHERLANPPAH